MCFRRPMNKACVENRGHRLACCRDTAALTLNVPRLHRSVKRTCRVIAATQWANRISLRTRCRYAAYPRNFAATQRSSRCAFGSQYLQRGSGWRRHLRVQQVLPHTLIVLPPVAPQTADPSRLP